MESMKPNRWASNRPIYAPLALFCWWPFPRHNIFGTLPDGSHGRQHTPRDSKREKMHRRLIAQRQAEDTTNNNTWSHDSGEGHSNPQQRRGREQQTKHGQVDMWCATMPIRFGADDSCATHLGHAPPKRTSVRSFWGSFIFTFTGEG